MMQLSEKDTLACYAKIIEFYESFDSIDGYLLAIKEDKVLKMGVQSSLFGYDVYTDRFFNDYEMSPMDMDISIEIAKGSDWLNCLNLVTTGSGSESPGRSLKFFVMENVTNKILGFCKLNSPTLNMKPRNEHFGEVLPYEELNKRVIAGYTVVPVQPFGFNCLGGKLLTLLCTTEFIKETLDKKYGCDVQHFETTSLYGSIKNVSQYDGMKPWIRYGGMTDSTHTMLPSDTVYDFISTIIKEANDGKHVTPHDVSNKRLKRLNMMVPIFAKNLQILGFKKEAAHLVETVKTRSKVNTRKRYYYGKMGNNVDDCINWWKKKALNRWETVKKQGRLRTEHEIWNQDAFLNRRDDVIR